MCGSTSSVVGEDSLSVCYLQLRGLSALEDVKLISYIGVCVFVGAGEFSRDV